MLQLKGGVIMNYVNHIFVLSALLQKNLKNLYLIGEKEIFTRIR